MPTQQGGMSMFMPMILIFAIFYMLVFRPQKKEQQEKRKMRGTLKKNDQAVTAGGVHGTVVLTKEKTVVLRVDDNVKIEFDKEAIATVVSSKNQT
ncbi:MAG: preprotein translocase subunit YajC [Candidatus Omnitrophica bacterium]|nr:preprotein translocase subunit YajC [Candidatus Omnitrophota bacterium]